MRSIVGDSVAGTSDVADADVADAGSGFRLEVCVKKMQLSFHRIARFAAVLHSKASWALLPACS